MSSRIFNYLREQFLSSGQKKVIRRQGRNILRAIARSHKIHEPLSIQRTNTTLKPVLVSYRTRVIKVGTCALTIRKPAEKLYAHYAARQVGMA